MADEVFLTGASGFIGSHVLRALLAGDYRVKALVRPNSSLPQHERLTPVRGDLQAAGRFTESMRGCRYLVHVAALYSFDHREHAAIWETNVRGTAGILEAGRIAGVERAVVTSSSATVGPARNGRLRTEEDWAHEADNRDYHQSKVAQERAALAAQLAAVLLLPSAPVGRGDWKPTPTGQMIVDFMRGRIFGSLPGGLNVVAVEDVARAHVAALEKGRARERYLIGGENFTLQQLWELLGEVAGRKAPRLEVPYGVAAGFSRVDEAVARLRGRKPLAPLEGVRMARDKMFVSSDKARQELEYSPTPVKDALARAVTWYRENGYA